MDETNYRDNRQQADCAHYHGVESTSYTFMNWPKAPPPNSLYTTLWAKGQQSKLGAKTAGGEKTHVHHSSSSQLCSPLWLRHGIVRTPLDHESNHSCLHDWTKRLEPQAAFEDPCITVKHCRHALSDTFID